MKRKNSKRKTISYCNVHPDSYMYCGNVIKDKIIGDEYFSVDI
jgi:hypothetical protein